MEDIPTKSAGDKYFSAEFNQSNDEIKNSVEDTGQVLSGSDPRQISKAMVNYAGSGDFYSDSGAADAYVLTADGNKQSPTGLVDGLRARFIPTNSNTGPSTINVATLGVKDIKKYDGINDLEANDLLVGRQAEIIYISSSDEWELTSIESPIVTESIPLFMSFSGLVLSNNSGSPTTDIDISAGTFKNRDTSDAFTLSSTLVKELDNVWVAGTNAGGRASAVPYAINTWYHVFLIAKADGTVDAGFDTDINATNLLTDATGYTFFRRRGSIKTDGASAIIPFTHIGNYFTWSTPIFQNVVLTGVSAPYVLNGAPPDIFTKLDMGFGIGITSNGFLEIHIKATFQTGAFSVVVAADASAPHLSFDGRAFASVMCDQASTIDMLKVGTAPIATFDVGVITWEELEL